jgi:hypothetical protein
MKNITIEKSPLICISAARQFSDSRQNRGETGDRVKKGYDF